MLWFGERIVNSSHPVFLFSFDISLPKPPFADPLFIILLGYQHHPIWKEGGSVLHRHFRLKGSSSKHLGKTLNAEFHGVPWIPKKG